MSYRIIMHRDGALPGNRRAYVVDDDTNVVVVEVTNEEGAKRLVELANRAERDADAKSKERTARLAGGAEP